MKAINFQYHNSQYHYPSLDGLRGYAVLLVILYHLFNFRIGWLGVDLFFVLSGFLITSILLDSKYGKNYFWNFYIKRVLRIFPLYYLVLFVFFSPLIFKYGLQALMDATPYFLYIQNITFSITNSWPENQLSPLNHFWSLAVEEQFYLIFPMIVYYVPTRRLSRVFIMLVLLSIVTRIFFYVNNLTVGGYTFTLCRMDGLIVGALTALYARRKTYVKYHYLAISGLLIAVVLTIAQDFSHPLSRTLGFTVNAVFFSIVLLLSLVKSPLTQKIFQNKFARHLGKYSYGLYVFHHIYFIMLDFYLTERLSGFANAKLAVGVLSLTLTYITAYLSFNFFEKPILALKKRLVVIE